LGLVKQKIVHILSAIYVQIAFLDKPLQLKIARKKYFRNTITTL